MLAVGGRSGAPLSKRAGQWLIGVEVALALVLMTGAGLILRSFARLVSVDLGFDTANVLTLEVEPLDQDATIRRELLHLSGRCAAATAGGRLCRRDRSERLDGRRVVFLSGDGYRRSIRRAPTNGAARVTSRRWASDLSPAVFWRTPIARPARPS